MREILSNYNKLDDSGKIEVINLYNSLKDEEKDFLEIEMLDSKNEEEITRYFDMIMDVEFYNDIKNRNKTR